MAKGRLPAPAMVEMPRLQTADSGCLRNLEKFSHYVVGCEIYNEKMEVMLPQLNGKDITELLDASSEKFGSVPCSGGDGVAVAAAGPASGGASTAPTAESKKEEKVAENEESDDVRTMFSHMRYHHLL